MKEIAIDGDKKTKYQIILLILIAFITYLLGIYKSNNTYFLENVFTITYATYTTLILLSILFIKNTKLLLWTTIILFLDTPFILKLEIQNKIIALVPSSSLLIVHVLTFITLVFVLVLFAFIIKNNLKYLIYFFIIFYSFTLFKVIFRNKKNINESNEIVNKIEHISKNYYFLLFDEYPSETVLKKYTTVGKSNYPSGFLLNMGFSNARNIFSNYINTELSTTAMLTGAEKNNANINTTIKALKNNFFTNNEEYKFNCISIFDDINRPNSLVSVEFFEGNKSFLVRYILPYMFHYFIPNGLGVFTDYDVYHNRATKKLNEITLSYRKNVTYIHFFTPHNYPLVENATFEERIKNANSWMLKSIKIVEKNDPSAGIIILSDHGLRQGKIPKEYWTKNILYYKNVTIDTVLLNKRGLTGLVSAISF